MPLIEKSKNALTVAGSEFCSYILPSEVEKYALFFLE